MSNKNYLDLEDRYRNKIRAVENQAKCFKDRLDGFIKAPLWKRLVIAFKGEL